MTAEPGFGWGVTERDVWHVFAFEGPRCADSICGHVITPEGWRPPLLQAAPPPGALRCRLCTGENARHRGNSRWCSVCGRLRPMRADGTACRHPAGAQPPCPGAGKPMLDHAPGRRR